MELFSLGKIGKTALSSPYHRPSIYWVMLKLIKGKIHYFVKEGKTLVKIHPHPLTISDQSRYGDKNQAWSRRILGLLGGARILLTTASWKEQELVSGNTCDLSDL